MDHRFGLGISQEEYQEIMEKEGGNTNNITHLPEKNNDPEWRDDVNAKLTIVGKSPDNISELKSETYEFTIEDSSEDSPLGIHQVMATMLGYAINLTEIQATSVRKILYEFK